MTTRQVARKPKGPSPTKRTLDECRRKGWLAGVVERFVMFPPPGHRVDLFGFVDVVVVEPGRGGILAIQATSDNGGNFAGRIRKIVSECTPEARQLLEAGNRIEVWAWKKHDRPMERRWWRPKVREIVIIAGNVEAIPF